ncbi:MAG: hypothetical protein M1839_008920 [Geoglossum umbratile]|nr:MAG: hypothetical protein M1839_008920 [Geoglossum umbratile]
MVSAQQAPSGLDPVKNMCLRIYQQSTVKNNTLYIDGGLQTFVANNSNSNINGSKITAGYNNFLIAVDMSVSWDWKSNISEVVIQKSANPLTGTDPPIVIDGALYQGGPGDDNIYLYGGTTSYWNTSFPDFQAPTSFQYSLWSFNTVTKAWGQFDISGPSPQRPSGGYWADAPNLGLSFYLGGVIDHGSSIQTESLNNKTKIGLLGMIVIDTKAGTARNVSTAGLTGNNPRSRGSLQYIERFGDKGILVSLGGSYRSLSDQSDNVVGTLIPMDTVEVFDIATLDGGSDGKWYKQKTSGDIPQPRIDACVVAVTAPDNSSTSIYLYGGRNDTALFDQIHVLSLPSFTWTKIFEGQSPRFGMTCHLIAKRQLLTVGGYSSLNLTSGCDWEDKGVGIYDLSTLIWGSRYNAYAPEYLIPTPVVSMIGGSINGSATMTSPAAGYTDLFFGHLFNKNINPNPSTPSSSHTPTPAAGPNKGAIAGGVVGGIAGLSLVAGAIIFFLRRRRPKPDQPEGPAELSGSGFPPVQEKDASGPHAELVAHTGHYAELDAERAVEIMSTTHDPKDLDVKDIKDVKDITDTTNGQDQAVKQDHNDVPMV